MDFSKVINLAKPRKFIAILNAADGTQWLSVGAAAYNFGTMTNFTKESIQPLLPKGDEWQIMEVSGLPAVQGKDDYVKKTSLITLSENGETYLFMPTQEDDAVIINAKYLKPIKIDEKYFFVKIGESLWVNNGLFTEAIIDCIEITREREVEEDAELLIYILKNQEEKRKQEATDEV